MSTETNKANIRRIFDEGFNQRRHEVFAEVIDPRYVNHDMPTPAPGFEGFRQVATLFTAAFPDLQIILEDVIGEGDRVATRGYFTGTHQGEFLGVPATGKKVTGKYIDIWRLENGKGVENWVRMDFAGIMQQLQG